MCVFVRVGLVNTLSGPSGKALPLRIRPDVPYGSVAGQTARLTACSTVNNGKGTSALERIVRKYNTTPSMLSFFQIPAIKPFSFPIIHVFFYSLHTFCREGAGHISCSCFFFCFFFTAFYSHWASFLFCVLKMHHLSAAATLVMLL